MNKPDIMNPEPKDYVTEPKEDESRPKLEVTDLDAEQITGGMIICLALE